MARRPTPWFRTSHNSWYVKLNGRQIRLGPDKKTADQAYHRLMLGAGSPAAPPLRVAEVADLYLDAVQRDRRPKTYANNRESLQSWCDHAGSLAAGEVKPYQIDRWLDAHPKWGQATRSTHAARVRACWRWAKRRGYLAANPLAEIEIPGIGRRTEVSEADAQAFERAIHYPELRDWWTVAVGTGCRPGELASLIAASVSRIDSTASVIGKMGNRTVQLGNAALAVLVRLMTVRPDGPLLRNSRGHAWTTRALDWGFMVVSQRAGVHVVPYSTRSIFASRAIARGVSPALVSKLLGHTTPGLLLKHYLSVDSTTLRAAVELATADPPDRT